MGDDAAARLPSRRRQLPNACSKREARQWRGDGLRGECWGWLVPEEEMATSYRVVEYVFAIVLYVIARRLGKWMALHKRALPRIEMRLNSTTSIWGRDPAMDQEKLSEQVPMYMLIIVSLAIAIGINLLINYVVPMFFKIRVIAHDFRDFLLSLGQAITLSTFVVNFMKNTAGRKWHETLRLRFPEYQIAISSLPCLKTADARVFLIRMEQVWLNLDYLLFFGIAHNFRKWRFFSSVEHRVAVDDVAKWLIPEAGSHVCVGFGNWSQSDNIKGGPKPPLRPLEKAMRKRATVVKVHEFRTSKLCSACYQPMKMAVFLDPDDPGPDELDADERPLYYDRSVLRCANKNCKKNVLNRDVNAAVNMQTLLTARLQGLPRPAEFVRQ